MIKGLGFLLALFLIVDIILALILFKPSLFPQLSKRQISVTSTIPSAEVSFANKKYLEHKLNKLGFWNKDRVNYYLPTGVIKVTVRQLKINLSDKLQNMGLYSSSKTNSVAVYSFGQKYDHTTGVMELTIHVDPSLQKEQPLNLLYSYYMLVVAAETIRDYPIKNSGQDYKMLQFFLSDFFKNPKGNNIFVIKTL